MLKLFNTEARWYDVHTPPTHYFRDHELALSLAAQYGPNARLLDVGCGTGVLIAKARAAGLDAEGFDASPAMIHIAHTRVPVSAAWVQQMQDFEQRESYNLVASLSWCIHYCKTSDELLDVFWRMHRALRRHGRILLQVAHAPHLEGAWTEDRSMGPTGISEDVMLRFRFRKDTSEPDMVLADYSFACASTGDAFLETHYLHLANAELIAELLAQAGFQNVQVWNSWRRDPFTDSGNVFVSGARAN